MAKTLDKTEVDGVLRYWLACMRHEEALGERVRASRSRGRVPAWSWSNLPEGSPYFKLDARSGSEGDEARERSDGAPDELAPDSASETASASEVVDFLRQSSDRLRVSFRSDHHDFLAAWVRRAFWRERGAGDDEDGSCVVGFPVAHFARRGQLDTLLKFTTAAPIWTGESGRPTWAPPKAAERRANKFPPLPTQFELHRRDDENSLPYALNQDFASRVLGVPWEDLQELMEDLLAREAVAADHMLRAVVGLLTDADSAEALPADQLWTALGDAVAARVTRSDVRVWPVAIVHPAERVSATFHVQRDVTSLLEHPPHPRVTPGLWHYLAGAPASANSSPMRTLLAAEPLSAGQRRAGELTASSSLTAAQGPPGTGKTHLVRHLLADGIAQRALEIARADKQGKAPRFYGPAVVVTSTNNRAVDNALDPFAADLPGAQLPMALRVGDREVTAEVTAGLLERTAGWLELATPNPEEYRQARESLLELAAALDAAYAPLDRAAEAVERRAEAAKRLLQIRAKQASLRQRLADALAEPSGPLGDVAPAVARSARSAVRSVLQAVESLADKLDGVELESNPDAWPRKTRQKWNRLARHHVPRLLERLQADVGGVGAIPELPDADEIEREGGRGTSRSERLDGLLDVLHRWVDDLDEAARERDRPEELQARLEVLEANAQELALDLPDEPAGDDQSRLNPAELADQIDVRTAEQRLQFWEAAVRFREAWALTQATPLAAVCKSLADEARRRKSLRGKLDRDPDARDRLWSLFPAAGCTLLSLGNAFAPEPMAMDLAIVDEGGQCHPAYAVSALVRSKRTLVIGDTHQLEPVVQLDAAEERRILSRLGWDRAPAWLTPYRVTDRLPTSAQALADHAVTERPVLLDHFRSQPGIIALSDALCGYGLRVHTPPHSLARHCDWLDRPARFVSVRGEQLRASGSWANDAEVRVVLRALRSLADGGISLDDIAVLTPYRGQLDALRHALHRAGISADLGREDLEETSTDLFRGRTGRGVALGTVHRFQGGEKDVVLLSTVVTEPRSLPFLNDRVNLINVAVSRARVHFVAIGHPEVLLQGQVTSCLVQAGAR